MFGHGSRLAVGRPALARRGDVTVEAAMTSGPSARLDAIAERMAAQNLTSMIVTASEGRLLGLIERERVEKARNRPL
jgi:hypothetical protein